jgi:hypothetical protein
MDKYILVLSMLFTLAACKKEDNPIASGGSSAPIAVVNGQIDGWSYGSGRHIVLTYLNTLFIPVPVSIAGIDSRGYFELTGLGVPSSSPLSQAVYPSENISVKHVENTFSCTDSSAKLIYGQFMVTNDTSKWQWLGSVERSNFRTGERAEGSGDYIVNFIYSTRDVKLSGNIRSRSYDNDSTGNEYIYHYNLTLNRGWNQQVRIYVAHKIYKELNRTIESKEFTYTNDEPFIGLWSYLGN